MTLFNMYICVIEHYSMLIFESFNILHNPSFMWCSTNPRCKIALYVMNYVSILSCDLACSQSVSSSSLHSFVIFCIIMTNCAKALSIGVDEFIVSLNSTLLHGCEPIKFHDPIITFKMFILAIIIGFHIVYNMSWVCKHKTQPFMM